MISLFAPSAGEYERLRSTVRSLGSTSVPGLALALDWRERKVERLLAHELSRPGTPLAYDPARRLVRWARPATEPARAMPAPPSPWRGPGGPVSVSAPTAVSPGPAPPAPAAPRAYCLSCHTALIGTGSGELAVCPECGRLGRSSPSRGPASEPESAGPASPKSGKGDATAPISLADKRSQELFAAYVTSRPIPCPKCSVPLRHRGVSQYSCPQCGQLVRFPKAAELGGPAAARGS